MALDPQAQALLEQPALADAPPFETNPVEQGEQGPRAGFRDRPHAGLADRQDLENLGAITLQLSADDLAEGTTAAEAIAIEGARYPDALEARTGL